jgi:hypothetical protein
MGGSDQVYLIVSGWSNIGSKCPSRLECLARLEKVPSRFQGWKVTRGIQRMLLCHTLLEIPAIRIARSVEEVEDLLLVVKPN